MKLTNLDYVQSILSSLGSDEVNSISDTTESLQVAEALRTTYFNIISRTDLTSQKQLIKLDPSLDSSLPVLMYIPSGIGKIEWLKYFNSNVLSGTNVSTHGINVDIVPSTVWTTTSTTSVLIGTGSKVFTVASSTLPITVGQGVISQSGISSMIGTVTSYIGTTLTINVTGTSGTGTFASWIISSYNGIPVPGYQYVTILPNRQFVDMVNSFNPSETNIHSFVFSDNNNNFPGDFTFYYKSDRQPMFCTILSNYYVIFDSYDSTQDSTLQSAKTMAEGEIIPVWQMTDSFIPNLDERQVPLLLNEAKSLAFFELKQSVHPKAEQAAKRQWSAVQRDKSIVDRPTYFDQLPNFGRRTTTGSSYFKTRGWDRP